MCRNVWRVTCPVREKVAEAARKSKEVVCQVVDWVLVKTQPCRQKVVEVSEGIKDSTRPAREKIAKVAQNEWVKPILKTVGWACIGKVVVSILTSINPVLPFVAAGIFGIWLLCKTDIKQQAKDFVKNISAELVLREIEQKHTNVDFTLPYTEPLMSLSV